MAQQHQPPAEEPMMEIGGFEADLFWAKHRTTILASVAIVVVAVVGTALWLINSYNTRQAAQAAFAEANNPDAWRVVIEKYARSEPAAGAYFLLAESLREKGDVAKSTETYQKFIEVFPSHPLVGGARLGIAENVSLGKNPKETLEALRAVKLENSSSYAAPYAMLMEGRMLMREGRLAEARKVLPSLVAEYSQSASARIAGMYLDQLSSLIVPTAAPAQ